MNSASKNSFIKTLVVASLMVVNLSAFEAPFLHEEFHGTGKAYHWEYVQSFFTGAPDVAQDVVQAAIVPAVQEAVLAKEEAPVVLRLPVLESLTSDLESKVSDLERKTNDSRIARLSKLPVYEFAVAAVVVVVVGVAAVVAKKYYDKKKAEKEVSQEGIALAE